MDGILDTGDESFVRLYGEALYTTPFLYRREAVDFLIFQRSAINDPYGKYKDFTYMGFPYGGDRIAFKLGAVYEHMRGFLSGLDALFVICGETDMMTPHSTGGLSGVPDIKLKTPSGSPHLCWKVSWDGRWRGNFDWYDLECFVNMGVLGIMDETDFQFSLGASVEI